MMKHRKKANRSRRFTFRTVERFLLNRGLAILGGMIILFGIILLVINHFGNGSLDGILQSLMNPGTEEAFNPVSNALPVSQILVLALHFIPGLLPFAILLFIPAPGDNMKKGLVSAGFLLLILAEAKIFLLNAYHYGSFFPGFWSALGWLMFIQAIMMAFSAFRRIRLALILSVIHFFVSIALIRSYFGGLLPFFLLLNLFQVAVLWLSVKFRWRAPFILAVLLSAIYISYYILTKIILPANAGPAPYMVPSVLMWLTITVTGAAILKTGSSRKIRLLMWDSLSYLSPFLAAVLLYFSAKITGLNTVCILSDFGALAVLILLSVLNARYDWFRSTRGFWFAACVLAASAVPYLIPDHYLVVFSAALPVAVVIHSHLSGSPGSFGISKALVVIMLFIYAGEWAFSIIPAISESRVQGGSIPVHSVLAVLLVASLTWFYIKFYDFAAAGNKYLNRSSAIRGNIALFLIPVIAWSAVLLLLDFALVNLSAGYRFNINEAALTVYAVMWIWFTGYRSSADKKETAAIIISYAAILVYPFVVYSDISGYRDLYAEGETSAALPFLLHYITLALLTLLLLETNRHLSVLFPKARSVRNFTRLTIVALIAFVTLNEYDNLSVLLPAIRGDQPVSDILRTNRFIPWSVILLVESIAVLIWSVGRNLRFMRRVSMAMIILSILKILVIDVRIASGNVLVIILISSGVTLIALAILVRRIMENRKTEMKGTSGDQISSL